MINDTISQIEVKIKNSGSLNDSNKEELLKLVTNLKNEVIDLSKTHSEDAASIANFTNVSADEAIRQKQNYKLLNISLEGMRTSVEKFETTHPELVKRVNAVCNFLANLGI